MRQMFCPPRSGHKETCTIATASLSVSLNAVPCTDGVMNPWHTTGAIQTAAGTGSPWNTRCRLDHRDTTLYHGNPMGALLRGNRMRNNAKSSGRLPDCLMPREAWMYLCYRTTGKFVARPTAWSTVGAILRVDDTSTVRTLMRPKTMQ